jgi:hypothetical protein
LKPLFSPEVKRIGQHIETLISQGESSQGYVETDNSVLYELGVLTRAQSQRLGVEPLEFPLPSQPPKRPLITIGGGNHPPTPPDTNLLLPPSPPSTQPIIMACQQPRRTWRILGAINVPGDQHDLPENLDKWLSKFDPVSKQAPDEHISKFILVSNLRDVEEEDVIYQILPYTFEGEAYTWYFSLQANSIIDWDTF